MQGLNHQASDSVPFNPTIVLRAGPHFDLSSTCINAMESENGNANTNANTNENESAKKPVPQQWSQQTVRLAVGSYLISAETIVTVMVEFAQRLKLRGNKEEACALLNRATDLTDDPNAGMVELFVWHMCADQVTEARTLLNRKCANEEQWFFMNAFASYKEHGVSANARSAMHCACQNDQLRAHALADDKLNEVAQYLWTMWQPIRYDELITFANAMRPVFDAVPGLQQWLIDCAYSSPSFAHITNAVSSDASVKSGDQSTRNRFKRLKNNLDFFRAHQEREQFKEAKKYMRQALRECQKLPIGTWEIYTTMRLAIVEKHIDLTDEVESLCKRNEQLAIDSNDLRLKCRVLCESGSVMSLLKDHCHLAQALFAHAADALETLHKTNPELDSYFELVAPLSQLAENLLRHSEYEKAEYFYLRIATLESHYLPLHHLAIVVTIVARAQCMHQLGRHQDEGDQIEAIQELAPGWLYDRFDRTKSTCAAAGMESQN